MSILMDAVRSGFYAQKQINSRSRLIAWSHRGRFATGIRLAREIGGMRTLDYGCGDGTFLAMLMDGQPAPRIAVGPAGLCMGKSGLPPLTGRRRLVTYLFQSRNGCRPGHTSIGPSRR